MYFIPLKTIYGLPMMCKELWKIENSIRHGPCHPRNSHYSKRTQGGTNYISLNIKHHQFKLNQNNNFIGKKIIKYI